MVERFDPGSARSSSYVSSKERTTLPAPEPERPAEMTDAELRDFRSYVNGNYTPSNFDPSETLRLLARLDSREVLISSLRQVARERQVVIAQLIAAGDATLREAKTLSRRLDEVCQTGRTLTAQRIAADQRAKCLELDLADAQRARYDAQAKERAAMIEIETIAADVADPLYPSRVKLFEAVRLRLTALRADRARVAEAVRDACWKASPHVKIRNLDLRAILDATEKDSLGRRKR